MSADPNTLIDLRRLFEESRDAPEKRDQLWAEIRRYLRQVIDKRISKCLRTKCDESDLVQVSLVEMHRDLVRFSGASDAEFKAWLRQIVRNNLIDADRHYRKTQQRDITRETTLDSIHISQAVDRRQLTASGVISLREQNAALRDAMAMLPVEKREILEYRHQQGWSFVEIGERLGISEQAARKRWINSLKMLKHQLRTMKGYELFSELTV